MKKTEVYFCVFCILKHKQETNDECKTCKNNFRDSTYKSTSGVVGRGESQFDDFWKMKLFNTKTVVGGRDGVSIVSGRKTTILMLDVFL